jgi:hypothetical protein
LGCRGSTTELGWLTIAESMEIFRRVEENLGATIVASLSALLAAPLAWLFTIFLGVKGFRDEWTYGFPLAFGIPAAIVVSVGVFVLVFRKLR